MPDRIPGNNEPRFFDFWIFDGAIFDWGGTLGTQTAQKVGPASFYKDSKDKLHFVGYQKR
jgi:hypothetical protein